MYYSFKCNEKNFSIFNKTYNVLISSYDEMYSGENKGHERFVRHEANGQDFEFSDGRFIVNARMEGSTYKPILHLSISPMNQDELGNFIDVKAL